LIVLFLAYYIDWLAVVAWSLWIFEIRAGLFSNCFPANPYMVKLFRMVEDRDLNHNVKVPATLMPEIHAADYSYEALEILSQNWRQPVVVRGLFKSSPAVQKWSNPDYLISNVFGSNETSTIYNGTIAHQCERPCERVNQSYSREKAYDETIRGILNGDSLETIVFPPASRSKRLRNQQLEGVFNRIVDQELDLQRIGGSFVNGVAATVLTQMFIGASTPNSSVPIIGTGWHGDVCNNFIVQITGIKRWIMVDPKYSIYMRPVMLTGKTAIVGGECSLMDETLPHFPHYSVDLHPGDFLYNPEWYWHSIENLPTEDPYSFGLVSRQCHIIRNFKSNSIFTSMILINHALAGIYDPEARQRIWSAITGKTLMKPESAVFVEKTQESGGYVS